MARHSDARPRRRTARYFGKSGLAGLVVFLLAATGLLYCGFRVAREPANSGVFTAATAGRDWSSYVQNGRLFADARTAASLIRFLLEPQWSPRTTNTIARANSNRWPGPPDPETS